MTRLRPPTWLTTAAGWALYKVIDAADWALEFIDSHGPCEFALTTDEEDSL